MVIHRSYKTTETYKQRAIFQNICAATEYASEMARNSLKDSTFVQASFLTNE